MKKSTMVCCVLLALVASFINAQERELVGVLTIERFDSGHTDWRVSTQTESTTAKVGVSGKENLIFG